MKNCEEEMKSGNNGIDELCELVKTFRREACKDRVVIQ